MKQIVTFAVDSTDAISYDVDKFRGVTPAGATSATLYFDDFDGNLGTSSVVVNFKNEANGYGFKKFCQTLTAAFTNQPTRSNIVISSSIDENITGVASITE